MRTLFFLLLFTQSAFAATVTFDIPNDKVDYIWAGVTSSGASCNQDETKGNCLKRKTIDWWENQARDWNRSSHATTWVEPADPGIN